MNAIAVIGIILAVVFVGTVTIVAANKNYISLYVCAANDKGYLAEQYRDALPKANIGRSCVRFKRFSDVDQKVVAKMLKEASKSTSWGSEIGA